MKRVLVGLAVLLAPSLAALLAPSLAVSQSIDGCPVFPSDNPWNQDVSQLPVHPLSDMYVAKINASRTNVHPDFGSDPTYGIPFVVVPGDQPFVPIVYTDYGDESDTGPMPIPPDAPIEGTDASTGDRHVLVIDKGNCRLYELYNAHKHAVDNGWDASSGAIFDLTSNTYRPDGWTSADAAGLPIFPGLARVDECQAGEIKHALRFTVPKTQKGWIFPARHMAGLGDTTYPPMGLRMRLKANYDISTMTGYAKVIATALKKYGMILADNGSAWFISGETNPNWPDDDINQLKTIPGSAFEAVYTGPTKHTPDPADVVGSVTEEVVVYPDPASDFIHVRGVEGPAILTMTDALGRTVLTEQLPATGISLRSVAPGAYILRISQAGRVLSRMVEVIR